MGTVYRAVQSKLDRDVARAVRTYFRVMAKAEDPDALDEVMDWEGLRIRLIEKNPNFELVTAEAVGKIFKDKFRAQQSKTRPEDAELIVKLLEISVEGNDATAIIAPTERDNPFLLVKKDGRWRIVRFPQ